MLAQSAAPAEAEVGSSRNPPLMSFVNEVIDRVHRSLGLTDSDFFCECGRIGCKEQITMSRAEYESLLVESRPLIVPVHGDHEQAKGALAPH